MLERQAKVTRPATEGVFNSHTQAHTHTHTHTVRKERRHKEERQTENGLVNTENRRSTTGTTFNVFWHKWTILHMLWDIQPFGVSKNNILKIQKYKLWGLNHHWWQAWHQLQTLTTLFFGGEIYKYSDFCFLHCLIARSRENNLNKQNDMLWLLMVTYLTGLKSIICRQVFFDRMWFGRNGQIFISIHHKHHRLLQLCRLLSKKVFWWLSNCWPHHWWGLQVADFHSCRHLPRTPVNIQRMDIEILDWYKYLGFHLTDKLDWTNNTKAIYRKGQSRQYLLWRLRSSGVQGELLKTFFDSVVAEWNGG